MAVDIFIKIDGVEGEANDHAHKKEIEVLSWNWGVTQSGTMGIGGGGGAGKANFHDMTFSHYLDRSSPTLMLFCANGKHIKEATLIARKAGGKSEVTFLKIKLTDLLVSGVSSGGAGEVPVENVTLNFAKVEIEYQQQKADGAGEGGPVKMGWDVKENRAL